MQNHLRDLLEKANHDYMAHINSKVKLEDELTRMMRALLPVGMIIDLDLEAKEKTKPWLANVRLVHGKSHGLRKFKIDSEVKVEMRPEAFEASVWWCKATPINADGKELSGKSHGVGETLSIEGLLFNPVISQDMDAHDYDEELKRRLIKVYDGAAILLG